MNEFSSPSYWYKNRRQAENFGLVRAAREISLAAIILIIPPAHQLKEQQGCMYLHLHLKDCKHHAWHIFKMAIKDSLRLRIKVEVANWPVELIFSFHTSFLFMFLVLHFLTFAFLDECFSLCWNKTVQNYVLRFSSFAFLVSTQQCEREK